jgi:hypothetical protein
MAATAALETAAAPTEPKVSDNAKPSGPKTKVTATTSMICIGFSNAVVITLPTALAA